VNKQRDTPVILRDGLFIFLLLQTWQDRREKQKQGCHWYEFPRSIPFSLCFPLITSFFQLKESRSAFIAMPQAGKRG
jgi:hypothetical protein